jgi:hypothetical protein
MVGRGIRVQIAYFSGQILQLISRGETGNAIVESGDGDLEQER